MPRAGNRRTGAAEKGIGMTRNCFGWRAAGAAVLVLMLAAPASAHHSFAMFDMNKTIPLEATVKELQWTNPHVWLQVVAKDPVTGKEQEWGLEMQSVSLQARRGWTRRSLAPGDRVHLVISPLRNGAVGGALVSATKDGKLVGTPAP